MLVYPTGTALIPCRTAVVSACDALYDVPPTTIDALATFQIKLRDKLDFTVDFTDWLQANGNGALTSAVFTVAAGSPKTPTIVGQTFSTTKALIVINPAVGDVAGDAYYLDITAQIAAVAPAVGSADLAIPARQMVRRINVVVING